MSRTSHHNAKNWTPNSSYKKYRRRIRRAKEKSAVEKEKFDNIPKFRRCDKYDYW